MGHPVSQRDEEMNLLTVEFRYDTVPAKQSGMITFTGVVW